MKLRIVNYREMSGGGLRFCVQLIKGLQDGAAFREIEFVSHGKPLADAKGTFEEYGINARFADIAASGGTPRPGFDGFRVPAEALSDCDVAWLPWCHSHRIPPGEGRGVIASFHDALMFTEPRLALRYPAIADEERETVRLWLESPATVVCSSRFSIDVLCEVFKCARERFRLVAISGSHARSALSAQARPEWSWLSSPYFLCPANISWHKNHEALLEGYARSGSGWPLVLTGPGSDLTNPLPPLRRAARRIAVALGLRPPHRARLLRGMASKLGLEPGRNLVLLGNLTDPEYDAVLQSAACLVMPTLGEGGGSFPVEEALLRGIPVICSDIPVLREQVARLGAEVVWFDPRQPEQLAARMRELVDEQAAARARARAQMGRIHQRTWADVASEYADLCRAVAAQPR